MKCKNGEKENPDDSKLASLELPITTVEAQEETTVTLNSISWDIKNKSCLAASNKMRRILILSCMVFLGSVEK